ncbi:MAG: methyltransferase domain-containing protein [Fusobacteriaceae bacterium]
MKKYNPFITSISRKDKSRPLRFLLENGYIAKNNTVLDFGAGKMKDTEWLNSNGYDCMPYDKYHVNPEINNISLCLYKQFDVLMCNYVFNVIEDIKEFQDTLNTVRNISAKKKFISIRNDLKSIKDNWKYDRFTECYFTGKSYQRFIGSNNLDRFFGKNELICENSTCIIIELLEE